MTAKPIHIKATYAALFILLVSIVAAILLGYSVFYGLVFGNIILYGIVWEHGYTHGQIASMMFKGIKSAWIVLLMMSIIGIIIGLWMVSGTIPTMMYMGFHYLSGINFVLAAFFITSIISMMLGTSLGTVSTVGMALAGIGKGLNIPLPLLVGTIVSGSYLGDRSSPMSSSANLTAVITRTKLIDNLKHMMVTMGPVYIICILFYYWIGRTYTSANIANSEIIRLQSLLSANFFISPLTLIPPASILVMAIFRFPMIKNLAAGLTATLIFIIFKGDPGFSETLTAAVLGFHPINHELASILTGGGLLSMKNVILIIAASTSLNGILDETGMIEPLIQKFISGIKSIGSLIFRTSFLSLVIAAITCNQTLAVLIPGKFLQAVFERTKVSRNTLARTISDTGIVLVPLIPWNVNAIIITAIFGVSVSGFGPYSILCYLTPMITILFGYMGIIKYSYEKNSLDK